MYQNDILSQIVRNTGVSAISSQIAIKLNNVMAMTKNMTKGKFNFAVHVRDEHDISFYSRERDELFKHIKECYFSTVNRNLPIYGVA